ncbi:hypothetical protein NMG60_11004753 [Bertholletia excelsa]
MATTAGRGAQTVNTMYTKPMLRKASYHKKSGDNISDAFKLNGEEPKNKSMVVAGEHRDGDWIPDHRTGIYYPKGHEKVMEDVPVGAGWDFGINWFSNDEDFI